MSASWHVLVTWYVILLSIRRVMLDAGLFLNLAFLSLRKWLLWLNAVFPWLFYGKKSLFIFIAFPRGGCFKLHLVRVMLVALELSSINLTLLASPSLRSWCPSTKAALKQMQLQSMTMKAITVSSRFNCNYSSNQLYKGLLNRNALNASVAASLCRTMQPSKAGGNILALHSCWRIRPAWY